MDQLQKSAFGELLVVESTPIIQSDAIYGLRTKTDNNSYTDTLTSGSISVQENSNGTKEFAVTAGTNSAGFALFRSQRTVRYRPGIGIRFLFTARFNTPSSLNDQTIGPYNYGNQFAFGYNGTSFGILHRTGGLPEIRTLTVSVGAGGNENVTITLNGVAKVVAVTAGTAAVTAAQIGVASYPGWEVAALGATVQFVSRNDTVFSGAFTLTSNGTTAGTFATTKIGLASTSNWTVQASWNVDKCNGSGPSGFNLNPLKGNVYKVTAQYLGYGPIRYFIENQAKKFILVHEIDWPNLNTTPTFSIPNFKMGIYVINYGNTNSITLNCASFAGFVDGNIFPVRNSDSRTASKTNVGTTRIPILSIRNRISFNNTWNLTSLLLEAGSLAIDGAKTGIFEIIMNGTLTGTVWTAHDATNSIVEYDVTATAITLGSNAQILNARALAKTGDSTIHYRPGDQVIEANDIITLCATASSATIDTSCSIDWYED